MNNPKLSVIIPVYNAENTIRRCLDSIINQTFHDWECLCINDGSTDNSGGVITEYANRDKRIKLLTQANGGVSSARNLGILHASGEWITFIDSDDAIAPAYFDIIETNDVDMILGAYESSKDNVTRHIASGFYSGRKLKRLFRDNVHILLMRVPWAKFCKRRLLQDLRFDQTLRLGEDTVFFHQYYKRCSSVLVDERPCYLYTETEQSLRYNVSYDECLYIIQRLTMSLQGSRIRSRQFYAFLYYWCPTLIANDPESIERWQDNDYIKRLYNKHIKLSLTARIILYLKKSIRELLSFLPFAKRNEINENRNIIP